MYLHVLSSHVKFGSCGHRTHRTVSWMPVPIKALAVAVLHSVTRCCHLSELASEDSLFIAFHCFSLLFSSLPARFLASDSQISFYLDRGAMHSWTGCHAPLHRRLLCTSLHCVLTHLRRMALWCPFWILNILSPFRHFQTFQDAFKHV